MPTTHKISFYPVGNGDTCQIQIAGGRRFLFDFCHRQCAEGTEDPRINLKQHLLDELKSAGRDYFDMVAFTHADTDHICGCSDFFELQHAAIYQGGDRIKIRELWLPAGILLDSVSRDQKSDEFAILRREGRYRLLEGKDIRVFSRPPELIKWLHEALRARGLPITARDLLISVEN